VCRRSWMRVLSGIPAFFLIQELNADDFKP
jgi:hypothetical protein